MLSRVIGPFTDLLNRLGLRKIEVRGAELIEKTTEGLRSHRPARKRSDGWPSDVSLVCAAVNQLIEDVARDSKAFPKHSIDAQLKELWRKAEERHPRADILELRGERISSSLYERYAALEKDVTEAIRGSHDDCLAALRSLWEALISEVGESQDKQIAEQSAERIIKSLSGQSVAVAAPEFSMDRWNTYER